MKSRCPALDPMHSSVIFIELHPSSSNLIQLQQHWGVAPLLCLVVSCVFAENNSTHTAYMCKERTTDCVVASYFFDPSIHPYQPNLTHSLLPLSLPLPSSPLSFCSSLVVYGHCSRSNFSFIHFLHSLFHSIYLISPLHSRLHESPSAPPFPPFQFHQKATTSVVWDISRQLLINLLIFTFPPSLSLVRSLSYTHAQRIYRRDASRSIMDPRLVLDWDHDRICFCWSIPLEQVTTKHKNKNKNKNTALQHTNNERDQSN